jgi:hypothetical protein
MTEDERKEWEEMMGVKLTYDEAFIFLNLPDDGRAVLVCTEWGHIYIDELYQDECGVYFEGNGAMDGIAAWMPLPEPYTAERSEE